MSDWLHVNGLLRIDGVPNILPIQHRRDHVITILGPMFLPYYDVLEKYRRITIPREQGIYVTEQTLGCQLPCGSEGSLQYRVIEYDTGLPWISIPFWGDLRDVDDATPIVVWLQNLCAKFQQEMMHIRMGVMTIAKNGESPTCYVVNYHQNELIIQEYE